jgi:hypothetical protein
VPEPPAMMTGNKREASAFVLFFMQVGADGVVPSVVETLRGGDRVMSILYV